MKKKTLTWDVKPDEQLQPGIPHSAVQGWGALCAVGAEEVQQ